MKKSFSIVIKVLLALLIIPGIIFSCKDKADINDANNGNDKKAVLWLTDVSGNILFTEQAAISFKAPVSGLQTITMNPSVEYQSMDGFGCALTGGSAYHIYNMEASARQNLLTELFAHNDKNIGISYLRVSIGASDLDFKVFSYNDLPNGETDVNMEKFSLDPDREYLIPLLKEILAINPDIKILGSPWSAPVWMKTNKGTVGGSLKRDYFPAYAKYFVKYVEEMEKEGITIDAITVQNEPLHPGNNPSMFMPANEQAEFVKYHLGPAFRNAGIKTKIIIYDHNADRVDYPISILNDPEAKQYIDGSAFHLYGGDINALSQVHNSHPDKNLYYTEMWVGAGSDFKENIRWHIKELTIGAARNWCKTVLEWNLAADENQDPHTDGGCNQCLGAITIQGNNVTRNPAYYIMAHAAKFIRPGSVRIESNYYDDLPNAAFVTPDGKKVIIVLNNSSGKKYFNIEIDKNNIVAELSSGAVGTYVWE